MKLELNETEIGAAIQSYVERVWGETATAVDIQVTIDDPEAPTFTVRATATLPEQLQNKAAYD